MNDHADAFYRIIEVLKARCDIFEKTAPRWRQLDAAVVSLEPSRD